MTHTVTVSSRIFSSDDIQSVRADFKLPQTEFRSVTPVQLPSVLNFNLEEGTDFEVDLLPFGTKLRMLAVKSTRPVKVSLVTATDTYVFPYMTYVHHLINSVEDYAPAVDGLIITTPPAALVAPVNPPARYPRALVEVFVLYE